MTSKVPQNSGEEGGARTCLMIRDGEMTIKINVVFLKGGWAGAERKLSKTAAFS